MIIISDLPRPLPANLARRPLLRLRWLKRAHVWRQVIIDYLRLLDYIVFFIIKSLFIKINILLTCGGRLF